MISKRILVVLLLLSLYSCSSSSKIRTVSAKHHKTKATPVKKTNTTQTNPKNSSITENSTSEVLEATSKISVTTELVQEYIKLYKEIAKDNMKKHGIPSSITLAQGILESGAGTGVLAQKANNHFGIKCHKGWEGESVHHDDDTAQECFRKYEHASESYRDHSLFLTSRSRYASLFKLDKGNYIDWAKGLKTAGYATDVKYPDKLIGLIERYELYKIDEEVLGGEYRPIPKASETKIDENSYKVSQGDTLYSISKKFSLSVSELMEINKLEDNAIAIGQILKIKS
jgi:flagellum-specific peptidoglycan hydrolase FlgJ